MEYKKLNTFTNKMYTRYISMDYGKYNSSEKSKPDVIHENNDKCHDININYNKYTNTKYNLYC